MAAFVFKLFGSSDISDVLYSLLRSVVLSLPSLVQLLCLIWKPDSGRR